MSYLRPTDTPDESSRYMNAKGAQFSIRPLSIRVDTFMHQSIDLREIKSGHRDRTH